MSELLGIARFRFLPGKRDEYLRVAANADGQAHADDLLDRPRPEHRLRGQARVILAVLHPLWLDLAVTVALFVAFTAIGTYFFVRGDRER